MFFASQSDSLKTKTKKPCNLLTASMAFMTKEHAQLYFNFFLLGVWIAIMVENAALFELLREDRVLAGCNFFTSALFAFLLLLDSFLQCLQ